MNTPSQSLTLTQREVLESLQASPRTISSKYFYDARGCELFDAICELPEYYPTRTELGIMERNAGEMADRIGRGAVVVEYGSGASVKPRLLLDALESPRAYLPLDIASEHLQEAAAELRMRYPDLEVIPVQGDFTQAIALPKQMPSGRRIVYFPGSTIGNLRPHDAISLLRRVVEMCPGGGMLLGLDLVKDKRVLEAAYNDEDGVTAEFNVNALAHLNRQVGADFQTDVFRHRAFFNERQKRIEMHVVAASDTSVNISGTTVHSECGESIRTELSHKYELESFPQMAEQAGMRVKDVWTDDKDWFAVVWLETEKGREPKGS